MTSPAQGAGGEPASIVSAEQAAYRVVRTEPDEILRHDIGDDELDRLGQPAGGRFNDAFWAFLGAALGGTTGGISALSKHFEAPKQALSGGDLFQIVFLFVMLALAIAAGAALRLQGNSPGALREKIRSRTKKKAI